jgi:mRNA-decapping enzyme subunit 2
MVYFASVCEDLHLRFLTCNTDKNIYSIYSQMQQAYWFYLDHYLQEYNYLPKLNWYDFCYTFFNILYPGFNLTSFFDEYNQYQFSIPVCGCVCVDKSKQYVLLLKGKCWSFPKGKINQNETDKDCAIRECFEETGLSVSISSNTKFVKCYKPKPITLYFIPNIDISTPIKIQNTEISTYKWIKINDLPKYKCLGGKEVYEMLKFQNLE